MCVWREEDEQQQDGRGLGGEEAEHIMIMMVCACVPMCVFVCVVGGGQANHGLSPPSSPTPQALLHELRTGEAFRVGAGDEAHRAKAARGPTSMQDLQEQGQAQAAAQAEAGQVRGGPGLGRAVTHTHTRTHTYTRTRTPRTHHARTPIHKACPCQSPFY